MDANDLTLMYIFRYAMCLVLNWQGLQQGQEQAILQLSCDRFGSPWVDTDCRIECGRETYLWLWRLRETACPKLLSCSATSSLCLLCIPLTENIDLFLNLSLLGWFALPINKKMISGKQTRHLSSTIVHPSTVFTPSNKSPLQALNRIMR